MAKPKTVLTERRRRMVERIIDGISPSITQAYVDTHDITMRRDKATHEASRIWRSAPCQNYAETLKRGQQAQRNRRLAGEQDQTRRRLWIEATPVGEQVEQLEPGVLGEGTKGSDRIAALRLIGQSVRMFSDHHEEEPALSPAELIAEITAALAQPAELPALGVTHDGSVVCHEFADIGSAGQSVELLAPDKISLSLD